MLFPNHRKGITWRGLLQTAIDSRGHDQLDLKYKAFNLSVGRID